VTRRPDESAALRALRASLTEGGGGHPAEELLLEYTDKRSTLATDVVAGIDAHLAQCPSCRDEVGVLDSMTIRPIRVTSTAESQAERSVWQRVVSALSSPAWRPALALAVLVVLMVPTLQLIGQDQALLLDMVEQHDDVAMTVNEDRPFQPLRTGEIRALNGMTATKDERQVRSDDEARATTIAPAIPPAAPAPSAKAAASVPSTPPPPAAALADAAPSPVRQPMVEDSLMAERHSWAARESESQRQNAFSARATAKQRAVASAPTAPTFDYVPGGRVSIAPGAAEHVMLRITFVRDDGSPTDMRSGGALIGETSSSVVLAPTVTEVDVVVVGADGRRNSRRVEVGARQQEATASMLEIPLDWLAAGENRVDVVSREVRPRSLGSSFVLTLQRPE
jgi:hypothetical protein